MVNDSYGPGTLGDIRITAPGQPAEMDLFALLERKYDQVRDLIRDARVEAPFYPEPGGMVSWGETADGRTCADGLSCPPRRRRSNPVAAAPHSRQPPMAGNLKQDPVARTRQPGDHLPVIPDPSRVIRGRRGSCSSAGRHASVSLPAMPPRSRPLACGPPAISTYRAALPAMMGVTSEMPPFLRG